MTKSLLSSIILLFIANSLFSQSYKWAAGLKLSKNMGMSVVYSPVIPYSAELVLSKNFWTNEAGISLIGRYHRKIISKGFNMYGGGGLHYGFYEDIEKQAYAGLLLNGGIELSIGKSNIAFNLTPLVGIGSEEVKFRMGSDISLRYIIEKHKKQKGALWEKIGIKKKNPNDPGFLEKIGLKKKPQPEQRKSKIKWFKKKGG